MGRKLTISKNEMSCITSENVDFAMPCKVQRYTPKAMIQSEKF